MEIGNVQRRRTRSIRCALVSWAIVALIGAAALHDPCFAASNDIDSAILAFPKIRTCDYRPDLAVQSANALISAGKEAACAALDKVAKAKYELNEREEVNEKVCHLCRLIFVPKIATEPLRAPRLGTLAFMPHNSMHPADWPYLPFAITNEVPLSMVVGYAGAGFPERGLNYLAYCKTAGAFRVQLFPKPTSLTASNALNLVLNSAAWKALKWADEGLGWSYNLEEDYAKEMLWKQVENLAKGSVEKK